MSSRPTTSPSSLQTGCGGQRYRQAERAHQMTEAARDHRLQRIGRARVVARDHRRLGHDRRTGRRARIEAIGDHAEGEVCGVRSAQARSLRTLGREDTSQVLILADDEHAGDATRSAELGGIGHGHRLGHRERGRGTERRDGALGRRALLRRPLGRRTLAREVVLDLLADSLCSA